MSNIDLLFLNFFFKLSFQTIEFTSIGILSSHLLIGLVQRFFKIRLPLVVNVTLQFHLDHGLLLKIIHQYFQVLNLLLLSLAYVLLSAELLFHNVVLLFKRDYHLWRFRISHFVSGNECNFCYILILNFFFYCLFFKGT